MPFKPTAHKSFNYLLAEPTRYKRVTLHPVRSTERKRSIIPILLALSLVACCLWQVIGNGK